MAKMSEYAFVAAMLSTGLATIFYFMYAVSGLRAARMQTAGATMTSGLSLVSGPRTAAIGRYATMLGWLATFARSNRSPTFPPVVEALDGECLHSFFRLRSPH